MKHAHHNLPTVQFIDADIATWFPGGLPGELAHGYQLPADLDAYEGHRIPDFEQQLGRALVAAHQPENDYHSWSHAASTVEQTDKAYDTLKSRRGWHIPDGFLQPVLLGTARHDCPHPGATFYIDADPGRMPRDAHVDMAVEEYAARKSAAFVREAGGTPDQQLLGYYIPAASTYGAHEDQGKRLNLARASQPGGISGLIMRAADILIADGDYTIYVGEQTSLMYGEKRPGGQLPPQTVEDYCEDTIDFLKNYALGTFLKLDNAVGTGLTIHLGWRDRVHSRISQLEEIQKGHPVYRAILTSRLESKYGIRLA